MDEPSIEAIVELECKEEQHGASNQKGEEIANELDEAQESSAANILEDVEKVETVETKVETVEAE